MADENTNPSKLEKLFEICPYTSLSNFERAHFDLQPGPGYSRHIMTVINRIRKIDSDLESETRKFERNCLLEEKQKLENYLEAQDEQEMTAALHSWEMTERDYWADHLGKIAALEILTFGKPRYETMTKMAKLPEDLYAKSTQICVKLANTIKRATFEAEEMIGISQNFNDETLSSQLAKMDHPEPPAPPEPKKLLLKKIKE